LTSRARSPHLEFCPNCIHVPSPLRPVGGVAGAGGGGAHVHLPARRRRRARDQGPAARGRLRAPLPQAPGAAASKAAPPPPPSPRLRGEGAHRASGEEEEGESAYFVWLNRGKESLVLDLARADDKALLAAILAKADVFVQNLKPGAVAKLGFPLDALRRAHPRLVICSISGYGEDGPHALRKAYDMLVQAESGLASVTGGPDAPARVGVSVCDIAAGMNAYEAILAALYAREHTGEGAAISISMFDAMAEWMAVPLIQYEGGAPPKRMGLAHTSIAPYGAFKT